jgi:anti-sigma regulatory factor (Ser/Thr protein kinase)
MTTVPDSTTQFRHEALFYDGEDELVAAAVPFLREGLERGEPALVVVGAGKLERLREELGDADGVQFADMALVGHNPARIIPAWHDFVAAHAAPGVRLRGIGEPVHAGRSADELVECQRHESLLNLAFDDADALWLLCPYDVGALPDDVLEAASRSHPFLELGGRHEQSAAYEGIDAFAAPFAAPLPSPPPDAVELQISVEALGAMRHFVAERATALGLAAAREFDFVLAVNEIATNSLEHGAGPVTLALWRNGSGVVCELRDRGRFDDPLAGRRTPTTDDPRGRGLWIANQLCDLVQIRSSALGTTVRVHVA